MRNPKKMSCAEAGKLGQIAAMATINKQKIERREVYYANPALCFRCSKVLPYEKKSYKFCSHTCSAISNNVLKLKNIQSSSKEEEYLKNKMFCVGCSSELKYSKNSKQKYCSLQCQQDKRKRDNRNALIERGYDLNPSCKNAKNYIIETKGHSCEICKGTDWFGQPMPLVIDHINGNPEDNSLINLRVICPNCDRFTPFFGAKNKGNGRAYRRKRYQEGKSY